MEHGRCASETQRQTTDEPGEKRHCRDRAGAEGQQIGKSGRAIGKAKSRQDTEEVRRSCQTVENPDANEHHADDARAPGGQPLERQGVTQQDGQQPDEPDPTCVTQPPGKTGPPRRFPSAAASGAMAPR